MVVINSGNFVDRPVNISIFVQFRTGEGELAGEEPAKAGSKNTRSATAKPS
jgi:hypothetical protein